MMNFYYLIAINICIFYIYCSAEEASPDFLIIINSQPNDFDFKKAVELKEMIILQNNNNIKFEVKLLHVDYSDIPGGWTILPLFKKIIKKNYNTKFVLFCGDNTMVNISNLIKNIETLDLSQELFIGAELYDTQPVIIHHYAFFEEPSVVKYPDLSSGFLLSTKLIERISTLYNKSSIDFSIDPIYELTKFLFNQKVNLTAVNYFCDFDSKNSNCATRVLSKFPQCTIKNQSLDKILFAVKTYNEFHDSRLKVLKETWGRHAARIKFFSNEQNNKYNTIDLKVPNTERGHCGKFMAILKYSFKEMQINDFDWLFVADDDTILSVALLRDFLSCYNPSEKLFIGERYGYKTVETYGYDYITLGGGLAISKAGLISVLENKNCRCPGIDSPDDMILGMCLKEMNIPLVHSPLFHQARADDYSPQYLANQLPVSFHRHWNLDPYEAYDKWFKKYDDGRGRSEWSDDEKNEL